MLLAKISKTNKTDVLTGLGLFFLALMLRLPYLGTYLTIDEVKWIEGAGQFLVALTEGDFAETYWHFFPGISITWGEAIILYFTYLSSGQSDLSAFVAARLADLPELVGLMRLSGVLITSLGIMGLYWTARPLLGSLGALVGVGLLAADPFFTAHSRIVNGDSIAAVLMMLAFLSFVLLWRRLEAQGAGIETWRDYSPIVLLTGLWAGLALLTKLPAPLIGPWILILALLGWFRFGRGRLWLGAVIVFGISSILIFILLWPAMWVAPVQTLTAMFNETFDVGSAGEGQSTFFLGQISNDPGWLFYPYALAFRLTPITVIGLGLVLIWLWQQRAHPKAMPVKVLLAWTLFFYILFVYGFGSLSPKKLDRYLMPVIPALILLAGLGLSWGLEILGARLAAYRNWVVSFGLLLLLSVQASFVIGYYPYILTYYNPLLGGYARAVEQVPVGWGEGLEQAAAWINEEADQVSTSTPVVSAWYGDIIRPYLNQEKTAWSSFSSSGRGQMAADYVVFYINQVQRQNPSEAMVRYFQSQAPVFEVKQGNTSYVWVYKGPGMQVQASGGPRIEGRARLLGYSWLSEPPHRIGTPLDLVFYLHTEGPLPDNETFNVVLQDQAGQLWGRWDDARGGPETSWQPGIILPWSGQLALPAGMPPGRYWLVIRLMDQNIEREVTRFDLDEEPLILDD